MVHFAQYPSHRPLTGSSRAKRKAVVLGESYVALSVVRALAKEGVHVILLASRRSDHACYSRFVSQRFHAPNPLDDSAKLLDLLLETNEDWDGALLMPTTDEHVIFLSENKAELSKRYHCAVQDWGITKKIIYKHNLYPIAREVGVPLPRLFSPNSVRDIEENIRDWTFPCILKPGEIHLFDRIYGEKNFRIRDLNELIEKFNETRKLGLKMIVSEIIPGDDSALFTYRSYLDDRGMVLAEMCTQKLRQYPPRFGQGAVFRTIPMVPEIRQSALDLLGELSYRGFSSVEFKWDHRDRQYKLMEINARPCVPGWLFVAAGMNFPFITYLDLVEKTRITVPSYRQDLYWIHNHWEMVNFFRALKFGELSLGGFFEPYSKKKVFAVPFFDDPVHFLMEIYVVGRKALKRLKL